MSSKKVNWKRAITLVVAVACCVTWLSSSVLAMAYNPAEPRPWENTTDAPVGDEAGWNEGDGIGGGGDVGILSGIELYVSKYVFIYFVPINFEQDKHTDHNDPTDYQDTGRGRTTSPE